MSLLRTKSITVGSVLAFTGVAPDEGGTFLWGNAADFSLSSGDVVKVIDIEKKDTTPWARVTIAVLKGLSCGRVGQVSIDLSARSQRSWQALTETGSMAPIRVPVRREPPSHSIVVEAATRDTAMAPRSKKGAA